MDPTEQHLLPRRPLRAGPTPIVRCWSDWTGRWRRSPDRAPGQPFEFEALREAVEALRTAGAGLAADDPRREALDALRDEAALETLSRLATSFGRGRITRELHERVERGSRVEHRCAAFAGRPRGAWRPPESGFGQGARR